MRATIADGQYDVLASLLEDIRSEGAARNSVLPFADLAGVHFARLFLVEEGRDLDGALLPSCLYYMADVDAPLHRHLRDLATAFGPGTDALFRHCEDYPSDPSPGTRLAWLLERMLAPAATYTHRIGRTVEQVRDEHRLREAVESYLDPPGTIPAQLTAAEAHGRVRTFALGRDDLRWARLGPRGVSLVYRVRDLAHLVALPLAVLLLLPVLVPAVVVMVLLIRRRERTDVAESGPAPAQHAHDLERTEDHVAQNPFTAVGFVKPGRLRRLTMRVVLFGLDYANRHVFNRDNLAGVAHDPLRPLGADRRRPPADLRQQLRRQPRELHGRLHRPAVVGAQRRLQQRGRLPAHALADPRRSAGRDRVQALPAPPSDRRRRSGTRPTTTLPARNVDANSQLRSDLTARCDDASAPTSWLALL